MEQNTDIDNATLQFITDEAHRRYPSQQLGTKGMIDASRRRHFIEGAIFMYTYYKQANTPSSV